MDIMEALNKACMYLLLDNTLEWEQNNKSYSVFNEKEFSANNGKYILSLYIHKAVINEENDMYYFDTVYKHHDGMIIITNESRIKVPHNDRLINEVLDEEELLEFIEINSKVKNNNFWFQNHNYDRYLIEYTSNLYGNIEKEKELVKR